MAYNADSIEIKKFRDACRSTPAMYLGDDRENGIFNCFLEILNNSCDEAIMGRGNLIEVELGEDLDAIRIVDHGIGIPHGPNKDSKEILINLFTEAHSSGKFNTENYKKVRGLHGVGSSAVCVCSETFEVTTKRDGYVWFMSFTDGIPNFEVAQQGKETKETGTIVEFSPNKSIFHMAQDEKCFNYDRIRDELELTSYFIPNVTFTITCGKKKEKFFSKNGLKDFAATHIKKPLHKNFIYGYKQFDDEVEVEVFAQWTAGKEEAYVFSNGALNSEGGTPITGAKTAFTRTINTLSKGEFDADMIRKGLVYIVNIRHPHPIYQNQVKNKIQNPELRGYTQTVFGEAIKDFVIKNKNDFERIVEVLTKEKRAEAAADRARRQILEATKDIEKNQKKKVFASDKLKDAEYLGENSILLIVEGNSAAASMAIARDITKYGILAIRGKMLNCLAHPEEKIFQNEEIKTLLSAMNIIPGKYDAKKLRYGKIAICVDADSDGFHIGLLIMSALRYLAPKFLDEGRLCWLRSPLYIVKNGKKETYYFTDEEFTKAKPKGEITRAKGLGALSEQQAKNSMFGENQKMDILEVTPDAIILLEELMGKDVAPRSEFIFKNVDFSEVRE